MMWPTIDYFYIYATIFISDPPGPPLNLIPVKIGKNFVSLEWKHPKENGGSKITKYIVQKRKNKKDDWENVMAIGALDLSWKVTDLEENIGYYFAVRAENAAGQGPPVETLDIITPRREAG